MIGASEHDGRMTGRFRIRSCHNLLKAWRSHFASLKSSVSQGCALLQINMEANRGPCIEDSSLKSAPLPLRRHGRSYNSIFALMLQGHLTGEGCRCPPPIPKGHKHFLNKGRLTTSSLPQATLLSQGQDRLQKTLTALS